MAWKCHATETISIFLQHCGPQRRNHSHGDGYLSAKCDIQPRSYRPRLASWNAMLQCLAFVQLLQGSDEFRRNLNETGLFLVDSMYKALV
jgi:hypothetical protein